MKRAIKLDSSLKAEFLDDPAFDAVWDSFEGSKVQLKTKTIPPSGRAAPIESSEDPSKPTDSRWPPPPERR